MSHKILHGLTGALANIHKGSDAMASGAAGGALGEVFAECLMDSKAIYQDVMKENPTASREQWYEIAKDKLDFRAKVSKISTAFTVGLFGGDANLGHAAAERAIDNNCLQVAIVALAEVALEAEMGQLLLALGASITATQAFKKAIDLLPIKNVDGGYVYKGKFYASLNGVLHEVMIQEPTRAVQNLAKGLLLYCESHPGVDQPKVFETPIQESKPTKLETPIQESRPDIEGYECPEISVEQEGYQEYNGSDTSVMSSEGRSGKQQRLKDLANDDKLGSADRGWIEQEKNHIKSGNRKTVRVPPGKELAHKRGFEASKGYDYSHTELQEKNLHKLQHKYDGMGRKNKDAGDKE